MSSTMGGGRLMSGGDHERSTLYSVREAARHDLYQSQLSKHKRNNLRRPRTEQSESSNSQWKSQQNVHSQQSSSSNNGGGYDEFDISNLQVETLDGRVMQGVTGIDYTSRPVTPARSNWSSRSLQSSEGSRPESMDDTDRPSTAMAFHADGDSLNSSFQQVGARLGGAHQRQRQRSQQRRDMKLRQEEKLKSRGMHDQPATSWSWAQDEEIVEGKNNGEDEEERESPPQWTPIVREMLNCLKGMMSNANTMKKRLEYIRTIERKINELMTVMYEYRESCSSSSTVASSSSPSSPDTLTAASRRRRGRQQILDQGIGVILDLHKKMSTNIYKIMKEDTSAHVRIKMSSGRLLFRLVAMCTTMSTWKSSYGGSNDSEERARKYYMKQILTVVKMVFMQSKEKKNDSYFRSETMLHSLLELLSGEDCSGRGGNSGRSARVKLPITFLIYATGTLKNCCMSDVENQKVLGNQGGIQTLTDMANAVIKNEGNGSSKGGKQIIQLLVQITGTLCALCKSKENQPQFWSNRTVTMLCHTLKRFVPKDVTKIMIDDDKCLKWKKKSPADVDLHIHCVRILSRLSVHTKGRDEMMNVNGGTCHGNISPGSTSRTMECLVHLCMYSHWLKNDDMLVRTLYVLGNVTAGGGETSNANRLDIANCNVNMPINTNEKLSKEESKTGDNARSTISEGIKRIDGIKMICTIVSEKAKELDALLIPSTSTPTTRDTEEVMVKAVRTLANLSLEPSLGSRLCRDSTFVVGLLSILRVTTSVPMPKKSTPERNTREELMMNVVSSLSNISYYGGNGIVQHGKEISRILVRLLTIGVSGGSGGGSSNESKTSSSSSSSSLDEEDDEFHSWLSLECARVYGNFSRSVELRACMRATGADVAMVMLMEHDDRELVHSSCGVLVNLAMTSFGKRLLLRGDGLMTILSVVKDAGTKDISLSTLACRALYNVYMTGGIEKEIDNNDNSVELITKRKRLRSSVWATLDELEDVVSDMVEDFEDDEIDENDDEWKQCRDFLSVVRPMLSFFQKRAEEEQEGKEGGESINNVGTEIHRSGTNITKGENDLVPLDDFKDRRK